MGSLYLMKAPPNLAPVTTLMQREDHDLDEFILPSQCVATSKSSGHQCSKPAIPGGTVCRYHGGSAPQVKQAAVRRLTEARDLALDRLIEQLAPPESPLYAAEMKDLLAVVDKLTTKVQLLSGEATERKEKTNVEEIRFKLDQELERLRERSLNGINVPETNADVIDVKAIEEEE